MNRCILIVAMLAVLGACTAPHKQLAVKTTPDAAPAVVAAPAPAHGLWAILDPGCAKPMAADIHAWPACASPFWISGDRTLVILAGAVGHHYGPHDVSYSADYSLSPGDPVIAQVGTEKDGFMFLALTDLARDDQGHLIGAEGAAVACPGQPQGALMLKPNLNGCDVETLAKVRQAAMLALQDRTTLSQVAWIAPGAP